MLLPEPLVIALDGASPKSAWTSYVTPASTWGNLPVSIGFGTEPPSGLLDAEAVAALDVAGRAWATPSCTGARFTVVASRIAVAPAMNGANEIVVHRDDWPPPLTTGAAAHTVIYTLGDRIVEADIHVNERDFDFTLGSAPPKIDLRALFTHELGHVLGIGHSADDRATMNAGLLSGIAARSLESDDLAAVCALYPGTNDAACAACPIGYACVGFECQREGEPGTEAAPCALASSEPRPCDGAGDRARCVETTDGSLCARECRTDGGCGVGLSCVVVDGDGRCLPQSARPIGDAGVADAGDAGATADAGDSAPAPRDGCSCTSAAVRSRGGDFVWLLGLSVVLRRRTISFAAKPRRDRR